MKTFRLIAAISFIAAIFAVSTFAQTPTTAVKVGLINTAVFDSNKPGEGITKYVTAMNGLEAEFKSDSDALEALAKRITALETELENIRKQAANPAANKAQLEASYNTKVEEYGKLGREFEFKKKDAEARFKRREQVVMGPVWQDIYKALNDYAKQKGYAVILDGAKLEQAGVLLAIGDDKIDVTKDFITFYNARPATTAVTNPAK